MVSPTARRGRIALPVLTLLAAALLLPCLAQGQDDAADLRRAIEQRYEVLPIRDGVLLRPRSERFGVRSIELAGDTLAVNGERLQPEVLRAWLAEEAEPVLRLHRLAPAERRALFGLPAEPGAAAPLPEAAAEAEAPDDEITEDTEIGGIPAMPPAPPLPPLPDVPDLPRRRSGSRVSITQNVVIEEGEVVAEAVAVVGSVRVDGEVRGDVVAVGGSATINGRVEGEVIAVGGSVILGPEAEVMRDVTSVGGSIERAKGAVVHGGLNEVSFWSGGRRAWRGDRDWDFDWDRGRRRGAGRFGEFMFSVVWIVFLGLLSVMALLLARGAVERVERQVAQDPWRSAAVGFLVQVFLVPVLLVVTIVLAISVIGWPLFLLYPFVAVALMVAAFLGYVGVALRLGRWFEGRFGRTFVSPYFAVLAGVVLIQIWWTGGRLLGLAGGFIGPIAALVLLFGFIIQYVAWTMGFGASLIAWSERRRERSLPAAAPPPPPPPPAEEPGPEIERLETP